MSLRRLVTLIVAGNLGWASLALVTRSHAAPPEKVFRAGAAVVDVSPQKLPVIINGSMVERSVKAVVDPVHTRALVLDDGSTQVALTVVDSCMVPRDLLDRAKQIAYEKTKIPVDRMLISATHTHSAPSCMGALGSRPDPAYVEQLPSQIAEAIIQAAEHLTPANVGWAVVNDYDHTHCRSWIRRPDRLIVDPFGDKTVRANMHPGYQSPDVTGPAGPVDPGLSILAIRSASGQPLAVLANYSMHYFGTTAVSADYFGKFCTQLGKLVGGEAPFVAIISQGTSGDQHWMDYSQPKTGITVDAYADGVAARALEAFRTVEYHPWVSLAMAETTVKLGRRLPDESRLAWARKVVAEMGDRPAATIPEVYAREAIFLHDQPERELKLQAVRIGELGIAAIPDEVFALTGLKIKAQSPLPMTFTMELANGSEGYIPPPEQHVLGGYTSWPARTAGLEVQAEPKILAIVLGLLESVAGRPSRPMREPSGPYVENVLGAKPLAYWRLDETGGCTAHDATGHGHDATYSGGIAYYLEGPQGRNFSGAAFNRAVHLAGGYVEAKLPSRGAAETVEFWFWNGLPNTVRSVTGDLLIRAGDGPDAAAGERLSIAGTGPSPGQLTFTQGSSVLTGKTVIEPKTWHHVVLVRDGETVAVTLDGHPEIAGKVHAPARQPESHWLLGGSPKGDANLEGKLDEIAVYQRALTETEIRTHLQLAGPQTPKP